MVELKISSVNFLFKSNSQQKQDQKQKLQSTTMAYYQQHMLSMKSRTLLANILAEVTLINQTVESYRQALADIPYFDTLSLFRFIDKQEKGFICQRDLSRLIGTSHRKLLTYSFTWMDNLKAGQVSRLEFATFLLPKDNIQLRQLVAQRVERPELVHSQQHTIMQQFAVFRQMALEIMRREMKIIELRRQLISNKDYSIRGVVLAIDNSRHNWVCAEDVYKFMKNFGFDLNLRQVEKLVEVLDFNMQGKLTEEQLKWTVEGLEGKDKSYLKKIKESNKKQPPKKPINFQHDFQYHKHSHGNQYLKIKQNQVAEGVYNEIVSKIKLIEQEQKQIDQTLLEQDKISFQKNRIQQQEERINAQVKRQMERSRKEREREEWLAKREMQRQIDGIIHKTAQLQAESERLKRLENRMTIAEDTINIKKNTLDQHLLYPYQQQVHVKENLANSKSPSFGAQSDFRNITIPTAPIDQTHLYATNYNSIARTQAVRNHIQSSDLYLQAARELRDKIKRQREVQKNIRQQFASNHMGKYESYIKSSAYASIQKVPGLIKDYKAASERKDFELGLSTKKKEPLKNEVEIRNVESIESQTDQKHSLQPTSVQINLMQQFGSPQPRHNISQQEMTLISKLNPSTANKPE